MNLMYREEDDSNRKKPPIKGGKDPRAVVSHSKNDLKRRKPNNDVLESCLEILNRQKTLENDTKQLEKQLETNK